MKFKNTVKLALFASTLLGVMALTVTPAAAGQNNPYGPGNGAVWCPDGTSRPYPISDPLLVGSVGTSTYNAVVAQNERNRLAALLRCTPDNGPNVTLGGIGSVLTEAQVGPSVKDLAVEAETAIVPPPMPNLACCTRPGQRTSLNLSTGSAAMWSVKLPSGATVPTANSANVAWTTTVIPTAQWISPVGNPAATGNYVYSTQFDASNCRVRCTITVSGKFLVDNKGVLKVDGVTVASSLGTPMYGFLPGSVTPFSYNIPVVNGVHTITFEAYNQSGPTGADIELLISRLCVGRVALQESSAPIALAIPTPTGCNPNNLPGTANPC
jgi:hypothetical protein